MVVSVTAPSARTRLVCLLGHPVGHSVSPQLHQAAFAAAGVDAVYLAFDVAPPDLAAAIGGLAALGALGANVTVPHKLAALALADAPTAEAQAVGAANTLWWDGTRLCADNTDAAGLADVLEELGIGAGDGSVLLGSGGAARAAAVALGRAGARVEVVARNRQSGDEVAALAASCGAAVGAVDHPRLLVNATPLGLRGEPLPDGRFLHPRAGQVALDLVYGPTDTPFLAAARRAGATVVDGRGMLVAQAARSFQRWTGRPAPLAAMRQACDRALAAEGPGSPTFE